MIRGLQSALGVMIVCALALLVTSAPLKGSTTPASTPTPSPTPTVLTSTLTLTSANNGQTFNNYRISTTGGASGRFLFS